MEERMQQKWNWKEQRERRAFLALEDGSIFRGHSVGAPRNTLGEVVFNTGMSGYQEILTDPSYSGQIVTMTYPEIGNTGINFDDPESRQVFVNGFVVRELNRPCNWRSQEALGDYLVRNDIPAISGVDTRALTITLRTRGTLKGYLCTDGKLAPEEAVAKASQWCGLDNQDYVTMVSVKESFPWDPKDERSASWGIAQKLVKADIKIVAYDFGIKWNILRRLREQGMDVKVVPAATSAKDVLALKPDGVFLSNGPADPAAVTYAVDAIRELLGKVPLMGICLGHQLMGLALGGRTYRLKFGHHGCNQPVMDMQTRAVEITSQNHNFAIDPDTLDPTQVEITHRNLNDQTVEGLRHLHVPAFSVQYHPEAAPGPHDASYLFRRFRDMIVKR